MDLLLQRDLGRALLLKILCVGTCFMAMFAWMVIHDTINDADGTGPNGQLVICLALSIEVTGLALLQLIRGAIGHP